MSLHPNVTGAALRIIDDAWAEMARSPYLQVKLGRPVHFPQISPEEAARRAAVGQHLIRRIAALGDLSSPALPHEMSLALRLARHHARSWAREADWYWLVHDPMGVGFFGLFSATAYSAGFLVSTVRQIASMAPLDHAADLDRYLALLADHLRLVSQMRERAPGQAERDILMPVPQVLQARALIPGLRAVAGPTWRAGTQRAKGGDAVYAELARLHTTQELTPGQVHAAGLRRMADVQAQMLAIRDEHGFKGSAAEYLARTDSDPRWRADTVEGVTASFLRFVERFKPHYARCFGRTTASQPSAAALPVALEGAMTFGYHDGPIRPGESGTYRFNAGNLTRKGLTNVGALNHHELEPGHHQHLCMQSENPELHPLLEYSLVNAYNEGWADYAATLAGELGCYPEPEERYGRLTMDAFLTCRLVVDTGMNVLGWSLEQAREYMPANNQMSEAEIRSESSRYSCDIPGQSLACKLGDTVMFELRARMQAARGERFSLKEFHHAVLHPGALPLPDLAYHLDHVTAAEPAYA